MVIKKGDRVKVIGDYYSGHPSGSIYNLPRGEGTVINCSSTGGFIIVQYDNGIVSPFIYVKYFEKVMKFEIGKKYTSPHCSGWIYECLGFMDNGDAILYSKKENIRDCINYGKPDDLKNGLYEEYKEPEKGEFWVNIFKNQSQWLRTHPTKESADEYGKGMRLTCIKINWTEGEGL